MKKLSIIITLLLFLMTFSACSQVKESGNGTDVTDDPQVTTQNNETTSPNNRETKPPETNIPETTPPETNAPETTPPETTVPEQRKTVDELAQEVMAGKWGVEPERKTRLLNAGYDYYAVQDRVNYLLFESQYTLGGEYKNKFELLDYINILCEFFNNNYKSGNDLSNIDLPVLGMKVAYRGREYFDFVDFTDQLTMEVEGDELRTLVRLLMADYVNLYSYNTDGHKIISYNLNDEKIMYGFGNYTFYKPIKDVYYANLGFDGPWAGEPYSVTQLQATETDTTINAVATLIKTSGPQTVTGTERTVEYTFNKVVYNDFLFYQLVEVKEATTTPAN